MIYWAQIIDYMATAIKKIKLSPQVKELFGFAFNVPKENKIIIKTTLILRMYFKEWIRYKKKIEYI